MGTRLARVARWLYCALVVTVPIGFVVWKIIDPASDSVIPDRGKATVIPAAPLCPWREPSLDLAAFFPGATEFEVQTLILSGLRAEAADRLGRPLTGDENSLRVWRIHKTGDFVGTVLTRRIRGESGAIEIVLAVDAEGKVAGAKIQRLREPDSIASALQDRAWLGSFIGRNAKTPWRTGEDVETLPPEARSSAESISDGIRTLLILLETGEGNRPAPGRHHH